MVPLLPTFTQHWLSLSFRRCFFLLEKYEEAAKFKIFDYLIKNILGNRHVSLKFWFTWPSCLAKLELASLQLKVPVVDQ